MGLRYEMGCVAGTEVGDFLYSKKIDFPRDLFEYLLSTLIVNQLARQPRFDESWTPLLRGPCCTQISFTQSLTLSTHSSGLCPNYLTERSTLIVRVEI